MSKEEIIKALREMAKYPTVTLPRDSEALKAAADLLSQPQQEPVAWTRKLFSPELGEFFDYKDGAFARETDSEGWTPLYTKPQPEQGDKNDI